MYTRGKPNQSNKFTINLNAIRKEGTSITANTHTHTHLKKHSKGVADKKNLL